MWIIELSFTPAPERLAARPAHRGHLTALHSRGVVWMAGPLADDTGAVIVVDAPDRAAVEAILAADPYFATPGVSIEQIRDWRPFLE
ncbi:YciI family protein [Micromonospora sp. NPDC049282]|uniref:YciI family protein n=1 Tax=Micromonospora sp. NPDC049282 TaxID=3364269 RepID=UPI00371E40D7